ncbi:MAG TPA: hypothetical protein ENJ84_09160 [Gammaproteobacteria bacterium]|nr:hypothetical protein [Gammaproteobacteria bacterium]
MFKKLRVGVLLVVLFFVSGKTYLQQFNARDWNEPLHVMIYPVNGDQRPSTARYIEKLTTDDFVPINHFMQAQAVNYGIRDLQPVQVELGPVVGNSPPEPPLEASVLNTIAFSLQLRFWGALNESDARPGDIRIFVVYQDPEFTDSVPHSLALKKGLLGLVYGYADETLTGTNNFVITHEMLHTLGATDKYDPGTNMPLYPQGFASPYLPDRYAQTKAEIMGGRIPQSPTLAAIPDSLNDAMIGSYTALEINWFR